MESQLCNAFVFDFHIFSPCTITPFSYSEAVPILAKLTPSLALWRSSFAFFAYHYTALQDGAAVTATAAERL
jgi:hypothetical protein